MPSLLPSRVDRLAGRGVVAFLACPGMVAYAIPLLLLWTEGSGHHLNLLGPVPLLAGTSVLLWCVRDFYVAGRGTLAPSAPPVNLVEIGLHGGPGTRCTSP